MKKSFLILHFVLSTLLVHAQQVEDPVLPDEYLTPAKAFEIAQVFIDSGSLDSMNNRSGYWKEYNFSGFFSPELHPVTYDSLLYYDSLFHPLVFYKSQGNYIENKKSGPWKTFVCHHPGLPVKWKLYSNVVYRDGIKEGWEEIYDNTSECKNYYLNGKLQNESTCYANGKLMSIIRYKDDLLHGTSVMYDENGNIFLETVYDNGKQIKIIAYENGLATDIKGTQRSYHENGKLKSESEYEGGMPHGLHRSFFTDGNPELEIHFSNGEIDGFYRTFYTNGQLQSEIIYSKGKPWNAQTCFSRKGVRLKSGDINEGNGTVYHYSQGGRLQYVEHYKDGVLIKETNRK